MAAKEHIASAPVLQWRGERTSPEFTSAAFALRDLIAAIREDKAERPGSAAGYLVVAERWGTKVLALMEGSSESRKGFAAALAHWFVSSAESEPDIETWIPLGREPIYECVNNTDYWRPPVGSRFFDMGGAPVSVTDDLVAFAWDTRQGPSQIDIDAVRSGARPISELEFRGMDAACKRYLPPEVVNHG